MHLEKKLVKYCFGETSEIIVKHSYKNCCITNALGDTGDDVWDNMKIDDSVESDLGDRDS